MAPISDTDIWQSLSDLSTKAEGSRLSEMFDGDPDRANRMAVDLGDIHVDFSRQRVTPNVMSALTVLASQAGVADFLSRMAAGEVVNTTDDRAALHTACRGTPGANSDINRQISDCNDRLKAFVDDVRSEAITGSSGKPFRNVVSIGVGGSELGPLLAVDALAETDTEAMTVRICSNIDGISYDRAFNGLDLSETLVIVTSKSFTTQETLLNGHRAKTDMQMALGDNWGTHMVAISANVPAAEEFGIAPDRVFPMWDWVGGRYSIWSAIGLPVALAYGWQTFADLRDGARQIDEHTLSAPVSENVPVLMALFCVWNTNFLNILAEACVPYDTRLQLFPNYLQQLEMESNGKRVTVDGISVPYNTQPVVFGGIGTNVQHAFFQQLHQGTVSAAVDIMISALPTSDDGSMHDALSSNALAQADALAFGRPDAANAHRDYPGNLPSTVIMYRNLDARTLGKLIAIYEHKTVAAACIWGINPFDQWGVELGKKLSGELEPILGGSAIAPDRLIPFLNALNRMRGQN